MLSIAPATVSFLVDDVVATTDGELVGVVTGTTVEQVASSAPGEHIATGTTLQIIVATTAKQAVVAESAGQRVVAFAFLPGYRCPTTRSGRSGWPG